MLKLEKSNLSLKTLTIDKKEGVLSKEQEEWIKNLNANGIPAYEAYGFNEAQKIIDDNFKALRNIKFFGTVIA